MILTAHQPVYLPWLGLFHKIHLAEKFCIFDRVQYQKRDFNNRNKIKTNTGEMWLTVPVESKDHFEKVLNEIKIINNGWNRKHYKSIFLAYKKARYFDLYIGELENFLMNKTYEFLSDLCAEMLIYFLDCLEIKVPVVRASDYEFKGDKSDLVLDMCRKLGATKYIFGSQGKDYANIESFTENKIEVFFQDYKHPVYTQVNGDFVPYMSIIDLLFNEGPESKKVLLMNNIHSLS